MEKKESGLGYSKVPQNLVCSWNPYFYIKDIYIENNRMTLFRSHLHANLYLILTVFSSASYITFPSEIMPFRRNFGTVYSF